LISDREKLNDDFVLEEYPHNTVVLKYKKQVIACFRHDIHIVKLLPVIALIRKLKKQGE